MKARRFLQRCFVNVACGASRFAVWVVLAVVALAGATGWYVTGNLGINTDNTELLDPELPFRQTIDRFREDFPQFDQTLLLVLEAPTPEQARQAASKLAGRLEQRPEVIRSVFQPDGLPFLQRNGLLYRSPGELQELTSQLADAQPLLARLMADASVTGLFDLLRRAAEQEEGQTAGLEMELLYTDLNRSLATLGTDSPRPLSWQELLDGEPTAGPYRAFVTVRPELEYHKIDPAGTAIRAVKAAAAGLELEKRHRATLGITGGVALAHDELQTVLRGAKIAGLLALVLVALVLYLGLRSVRLVTVSLLTLLVGLLLTAGFATVAVGRLNLISVAFAVLYVGLGVDYAVHFLLRYREARAEGISHRQALGVTAQDMGGALGLCTLSTSVAFFAFVPSAFLGVSELGLIAGAAMIITLLLSFTLLPALIALFRVPAYPALPPSPVRPVQWLLGVPEHHRHAVRWGALVLGLAGLAALAGVRFDYNPLNLRNQETESVATLNTLLNDPDSEVWNVVALAPSAEAAREKARALRRQEVVKGVRTVFELLPARQEEKLATIRDLRVLLGPAITFGTPQARDHTPDEALASLRAFRQTLDPGAEGPAARLRQTLDDLVTGLENAPEPERTRRLAALQRTLLGNLDPAITQLQTALSAERFSLEGLPPRLKARWVSPDGTYHIEATPEGDLRNPDTLRAFVHGVQEVAPEATGTPVLHYETGRAVVTAFQQALILAVLGISLILLVTLRSFSLTLTVLIPLLLGGVLTGAATALLHIPFNFSNIIALPLLLGISVDNGIHMVHRHRLGNAAHGSLLKTSTARAILFSTLTTVCSFGNLLFSPHPGTASMGAILTIGILLTLVSTLLVLPALLHRGPGGQPRPASPP